MRQLLAAIVIAFLSNEVAIAEHHHTDWNKFFSGTWEFEGRDVKTDLRLVGDGVAAIGTGESKSGEMTAWVMGWDPAEKMIVHQWFGKTHGWVKYKIVDETKLHGKGEIHGSEEVTKGTVTISKIDDDSYTVRWTDVTINGKTSEDMSLNVKRR